MAQVLLFASPVGNLLYKDSNPLVCHSDTKNYLAAVIPLEVVVGLALYNILAVAVA